MKRQWERAADEYLRQAERAGPWQPSPRPSPGRWELGEQQARLHEAARATDHPQVGTSSGAAKRPAVNDAPGDGEELTLMLPPEVHKRLRGQAPPAAASSG